MSPLFARPDDVHANHVSSLARVKNHKRRWARLSLPLIVLACLSLLLLPLQVAQAQPVIIATSPVEAGPAETGINSVTHRLALAQTAPLIVINEIMKDPNAVADAAGEWLELYNAGSQPFDLNGCILRDDGTDSHVINNGGPLIINPDAYLVLGNNGDSGANGGVNIDYVYTGFTLANAGDEVVLVCGGLEIDRVNYDDGLTFPDPIGFSLQLAEPTLDNNAGSNWCQAADPWPDSAGDSGTPGTPTVCATFTGTVVINEIMADPAVVSDANGEWLELYNPGSSPVDINGCQLIGNTVADNHFINNGGPLRINPGQYLVLGRNGNPATNGGVIVAYTYTIYSLANTSDVVVLECAGIEVDRVNYSNATFPGPTTGASMQLEAPSLDNNAGANWCVATIPWSGSAGDSGTPGAASNCPADLALTKTASPDVVLPGQTLIYTLVYINNGPSAATEVVITDLIPSALTNLSYTSSGAALTPIGGSPYAWRVADLLPGVGGIITITGIINPDFPAPAVFTNTATIASTALDSNTTNNTASVTTTVIAQADLTISKSDSPDPVTVGESLIYTLQVSNAGPSTATDVTVTDTLPGEVTFVSASGTGWSCSQTGGIVTCTRPTLNVGSAPNILITVTAPGVAGVITNTASVTSSITDPTLPNTASAVTTVTAQADLSINKSDSPDPISTNQTLTYTLNVNNAGPSVATAITVTDTLPTGVTFINAAGAGWSCSQAGGVVTCTRPTLDVGSAPDIVISVTAPGVAGVITNTASVTSNVADPTTPNTAIATTTVTAVAAADLSITKSDSPDPVTIGGTVTYSLNVSNDGPSPATAVTVTDTLPAGVSFVGATGAGWSCSQAGGVVTCTRPTLDIGSAPEIVITVTAPGVAGVITNRAIVTSTTPDPTTPNIATTATTVEAPTVQFSSAVYNVNENTGTATLTATLSAASGLTVTVSYASSDGTALAGSDYLNATGTLTFPPDSTVQTFTVTITDDLIDEPNETLTLALSNPNNATLGALNPATLTIVDNDEPPTLSINNVSVTEGDVGTVNAVFTVSLTPANGQPVTVEYGTANGTATAPADYIAIATSTLTFAPGVTSRLITVTIQGDTVDEPNETFLVNLANASGATIADGQGVGTIVDDDGPPALSINDVSVIEGDIGTVNAVFTVSLVPATGQTVTVEYGTANGTATSPVDYTAISTSTLTFPPGVTSQLITVTVQGDTLDEPNENFLVNLANPTAATIADGQGIGTILDDDGPPVLLINDVSVTEGDAGTVNAVFMVNLTPASGQTVTVEYVTANGSATAPADYTAISTTTLTFPPGVTSQLITVTVQGDTADEPNESFLVNLANASGAAIADSQGMGTIVDDDGLPVLSINDVSMMEGDVGTVNAVFMVTLTPASQQPVTVEYATANSTAIAPADYTAIGTTTLTFAPDVTSRLITVTVQGDTLDELNETFLVNLANSVAATIADSQGVGTILDDDGPLTVQFSSTVYNTNEAAGAATLTATLSAVPALTVTVDYTSSDGTALAGSDYLTATGTLTFAPGSTVQTFTITIADDLADEPNETLSLALSNPNNATLGAFNPATLTIVDNDGPPTLSINNLSVTEGDVGTINAVFTVSLVPATGQTVTVEYGTANGTATAPTDYTSIAASTLTFAPGATGQLITVTVQGDAFDEPNETFLVNLANPTAATIAAGQGVGTIVDDDEPPSVQFDSEAYSVDEAASAAILTATLSAATTQMVTVNYTSSDGTALAGSDYLTATGALTFAPGATVQTFTITITDDLVDELDETLTLALNNPANATLGTPNPATLTIVDDDAPGPAPTSVTIYLPLVMQTFTYGPDLVVSDLIAGSNAVTVTIKNTGNAPVNDAFWVDVYLNPNPPPTGVNQEWWELASEGLVWGVTQTLPAGGELTLTIGDAYYSTLYSGFSGTIPLGTPVWAQVDSVNLNTTYGGALESNETNNISGPVLAATGPVGAMVPSATSDARPIATGNLPPR